MARRFLLGCSFGVMQGRLSPQTDRGYQVFPWATWQAEFDLAAGRGLEHIEWVLDSWRVDDNPILSETGAVIARTEATGVRVITVCADYLMDNPLDVSNRDSWTVLGRLVNSMRALGAEWLVLPCVDQSSLGTQASLERLKQAADPLTELLSGTNIKVSLESDLGPAEFASLLGDLDPEVFGVNYDIGNSSYLGYTHDEEFDAYGDRISLVHVKDRALGGNSVPLGSGDANIPGAVERLRAMEFNGPVTMQAFRDIQGVGVLDEQLHWMMPFLVDGAR